MEHGSFTDDTKSTFAVADEDHTLANAIRFTLNQDPRVSFCGYSIPHPSDNRVNIRVQTTGDPAKEVLKDACQDLMLMCQHVRGTFDKAVVDFKTSKPDYQRYRVERRVTIGDFFYRVSWSELHGSYEEQEGRNIRKIKHSSKAIIQEGVSYIIKSNDT